MRLNKMNIKGKIVLSENTNSLRTPMEISLENLHVDINAERANHVSSMWHVFNPGAATETELAC